MQLLKLGWTQTYFTHPADNTQRVQVILDVCHIIKLLRNQWASVGKFVDPDGNIVDFGLIRKLHELQEEEVFRFGNKIKTKHIEFQKQKMKVSLTLHDTRIIIIIRGPVYFVVLIEVKHTFDKYLWISVS